jgi:hypothetical protein
MKDGIPVEFEYEGKMYKGFLGQPHGAGTKGWQLSVCENKNGKVGMYHWGQLVIYGQDDWRFMKQQGDMLYLSGYFRDVVLAWYQ